MTFKHKLSHRLALLKDRRLALPLAALAAAVVFACEKPLPLSSTGPVASLVISPKVVSVHENGSVYFTAAAFMSTGDSANVAMTWSATSGTVTDMGTSPSGRRHYGQYAAGTAGQYKVAASGGGASDTATVTVTLAPVAAVSVAPPTATIVVGATVQLQATTTDSAGNVLTGRTLTWSSDNGSVATVSGSGLVTASGTGSATITAMSEGRSGTASITVSSVPVASVTVSPASVSLQTGQTAQLTATPKDANGTPLSGRVVTWSSSDTTIAKVSGSGLVTARLGGSATITATSEGQSGTATVTVTFVPVASVTVSPASASLQVGQTTQLTATPKDASGNPLAGRVVTWSSSNATVAAVNGTGLVSGQAAGSATITATSEGQSGTSSITVTLAPVATVSVTPTSAAIQPGQTVQLTATTKDANGNVLTGRVVTWSTSDGTIATVSTSGLVAGVAAGTATITATSEGKSGTATILVGTPPPPAGCAPTGGGRCYYVDAAAGNDGNPGDSAHPFQTVQHAADLVNPGDMVIVRDGVYTGSSSEVLAIGRGGTASNWVVFRAEHKWGAALDGQGTPGVQGVSDAGVHFSASYVRVEGFEIRGMWHDGVDMGAPNIVLSGNHIHNVGGYCEPGALGISAIAAYASNLVIEQNLIHDIGRLSPGQFGCSPGNDYWQNHDHGIYLSDGVNVIIRNNVFYNMVHGWDVHRYGSTCDQVYIVNNTFAYPNPNRDGHIILASTTTNLYIQNNIFYLPGQNIGISGTQSGAIIDHNLSTAAVGGGGTGTNIENTDPQMVNPTGLDFRLLAGSPAVDAGIALAIVLNDFAGMSRPQGAGYDIGAFESH